MERLFSAFVSHSSRNDEFVQVLVNALSERSIEVWDDRLFRIGDNWKDIAGQKIREPQVLLLIITPESYNSDPVLHEIKLARYYRKPIVPILLEPLQEWSRWGEVNIRDTIYQDFTGWHLGTPVENEKLNRLIDSINEHRIVWFRQILRETDPLSPSGEETVRDIEQMAITVGERAFRTLTQYIVTGVMNMDFEPPKSTAVFSALAMLGGDAALSVLEMALEAYRPHSENMKAIIRCLGYVGDKTTEVILHQKWVLYEKLEPNSEMALIAYNAKNRIRVRVLNNERGTNFEARDVSE